MYDHFFKLFDGTSLRARLFNFFKRTNEPTWMKIKSTFSAPSHQRSSTHQSITGSFFSRVASVRSRDLLQLLTSILVLLVPVTVVLICYYLSIPCLFVCLSLWKIVRPFIKDFSWKMVAAMAVDFDAFAPGGVAEVE